MQPQHSYRQTARSFKDFRCTTLDSWSSERRIIGTAEVNGGEANPRFVVTSLKRSEANARLRDAIA
ncbi:MAG TPA: hypothetical protein VGL95_07960 [Acetobacteraceae bacterium]